MINCYFLLDTTLGLVYPTSGLTNPNNIMTKKTEQKDVHVYFSRADYEALQQMALDNMRSISAEVVMAVRKKIEEHEIKHPPIER